MISFPVISSRKLRTLVVTGGDEGYFSLLDGLIDSLHQWDDDPFADLACFDSAWSRGAVPPWWRGCRAWSSPAGICPLIQSYADAWVQRRFALEWLAGAAHKERPIPFDLGGGSYRTVSLRFPGRRSGG